jgi:hypothetical protein
MMDTVVLFAGHRVDEPGRTPPRFPAECETKARLAIESVMRSIAGAQGSVLGIAGAADGGDILFHEVCAELGILSEVCLALPVSEYVHTSVQASWTDRFHRLLQTHPTTTLEPGSGDLWLRDHEWQMRRARERHPHRTVLLALQRDVESDIPGGTSGMVRIALESGVEVIHLDAREICG